MVLEELARRGGSTAAPLEPAQGADGFSAEPKSDRADLETCMPGKQEISAPPVITYRERNAAGPGNSRFLLLNLQTMITTSRTRRVIAVTTTAAALALDATALPASAQEVQPAVSALRFSAEAATVGTKLTGSVTLDGPAPAGGSQVTLWRNTYSAPSVLMPAKVTVPAGKTSVSFPATAYSAEPYDRDHAKIITPSAHLGTSLASRELVLLPTAFALSSGVARPGTGTKMAVGIGTPAPAGGATVALKSNTADIKVPATVTIPAGSPGVSFPASVASSAQPGGTGQITATWQGSTTTSAFYLS
ncbi:hypothetical protein [Actinomadura sp. NEAU-AAG7]|uniref:hypothetical protein n=1 Tax=Actinomadura sp. NEAU-AAG7 TaxID=2839640 RepID=UPI001BE4737B|nr:hypothetical protein [Actinomadura sp. NEAU-AAG7]MBT2212418.1 hypothetical protein [Actinomadura sp. NEAU-AAG7]